MAIEIGDKMAQISICFKLPNGFEPKDMNDVLEEILKYRKSEKNHDKDHVYNSQEDLYSNFWTMVNETNRPFVATFGLGEFNGKNWIDLLSNNDSDRKSDYL